jgi:hypothetical protein
MKKIKTFSQKNMNGEIYKYKENESENHYILKANYVGNLPAEIHFWASNPPDTHVICNKFIVPFPNAKIAYENTPNFKKINLEGSRNFEVDFMYPNSYYENSGTIFIPPHLHFKFYTTEANEKVINNSILKL